MENSDVLINIKDRTGKVHQVSAPTDMNMNLMELIRAYEIAEEGTIGICGGMAMCASCQCYITDKSNLLQQPSPDELAMLDQAYYVKENSRLGCQIPISKDLIGIDIEIAPEQ